MFKKAALAAIVSSTLATSAFAAAPKYVFLFVGDGLASPQRDAAEIYLKAQDNPDALVGRVELTMSKFPAHGITTNQSLDDPITDSAASATALATGITTRSRYISMAPGGQAQVTVAEDAKKSGMKVGIVSSAPMNHATPAAFYAKSPSRSQYYKMSLQWPDSDFDYYGGGHPKYPTGRKKNMPPIYPVFEDEGYTITYNRKDMESLKPGQKAIAFTPSPLEQGEMPWVLDNVEGDISLSEFVDKGIEVLDNDKGFFMMVEGGKIDWAGHQNDAKTNIYETLAFDDAISVAYDFYERHPKETLIVVTGDHETGGMTLGFVDTPLNLNVLKGQTMAAETFGNKIEAMREDGSLKFETVMELIEENFGLRPGTPEDFAKLAAERKKTEKRTAERKAVEGKIALLLNEDDMKLIRTAYQDSKQAEDPREDMWEEIGLERQKELAYGGKQPLAVTMSHILNSKAGIGWTTYSHTAVPVLTSAVGVGSEKFNGLYENVDIYKHLKEIMDL